MPAAGQTSPGGQHVPRQQNPSPQSFSVWHMQTSNSASKQYGMSASQQIEPQRSPSGQGSRVVEVVVSSGHGTLVQPNPVGLGKMVSLGQQ
jgi:hypothetical protein